MICNVLELTYFEQTYLIQSAFFSGPPTQNTEPSRGLVLPAI